MKILADSNIFIDFWKRPDQMLIDTFASEDVVICGVARADLMHGANMAAFGRSFFVWSRSSPILISSCGR